MCLETNGIKVALNRLVCKVVGIKTETGKFLFVQSGIHKSLASIARNLGLWNPNSAQKFRNPNSIDKESGIKYLEFRIHSVESMLQDCFQLTHMR